VTIHIQVDNFNNKYMVKTALILLLLYSLSFCNIEKRELEVIDNISSPHQVQWISNEDLLIVKEKDIFKYNIYSKNLEKIGEREPNSFVSLDSKGELIFCEFEHFIINSPDEFSTIFRIKNSKEEVIKEIKIFETIRPIRMNESIIIAVTAVDFLEEHYYKIDIESEQKEEIAAPNREMSLDIPKYIDARRVFVKDKDLYIIEDMRGNLILYNNLIRTNTIMDILTATFNPVPMRNPRNDANPNFILWLKSFLANIYSATVAPKNEPINTPGILPINPPSIEPSTEPIEPYLDPPAFLVPSAPASSSANVESTDITKRITSINGVMV